jgi:type II secretory pathway component PulC
VLRKLFLKKMGTLYTLYLYEENANTAVAKQSVVVKAETSGTVSKGKVEIKNQEMFSMIKQKDGNYFIPRALVKEYLQLETIFTQIKVVGMFVNDEFDGFLVQSVHPSGIFARLGLQRGDKIKKVNDKPLKNMQEPFEYFNRLDAVDKLKLSIIRKNKEEELMYEMY